MTWFQKFIHSPFFNKHKEITELVDYFTITYPDFTEENCDREFLFNKFYPKQKFDLNKLKHLFSFTLDLAEEFVVIRKSQNQDELNQIMLVEALSERNLEKRYERQLKKAQKLSGQSGERDHTYYYNKYLLSKIVHSYSFSHQNRQDDQFYHDIDQNLDIFYMSEKLRNSCAIASREITFKSQASYPIINDLIAYIKKNIDYFENHPLILLYFSIYRILTGEENKEAFLRVVQDLNKYQKEFTRDDSETMYGFCTFYCIDKINKGNSDYLKVLFDLYRDMLTKGLLYEQGILSEWRYKNLVTVGIRLKEYEWTEKFIHDYKNALEKKVQQNAFNYNLANFYYSVKRNDDALEILNNVRFTDLVYILDSRTLMLKIFFDLDEEETLNYQLDAFKSYIKRNKNISDSASTRYNNLLKHMRQIQRLRGRIQFNKDKKAIADLKKTEEQIKKNRSKITNPPWLLSKIQEITNLV